MMSLIVENADTRWERFKRPDFGMAGMGSASGHYSGTNGAIN
jgi:hypothetical protein